MLIILEQVGVLMLFCAIGFILAKKNIIKAKEGGMLSGLLRTVNTTVYSAVLNLFLKMTGGA